MISTGSGMATTSIILILTDGDIHDQAYAQRQVFLLNFVKL